MRWKKYLLVDDASPGRAIAHSGEAVRVVDLRYHPELTEAIARLSETVDEALAETKLLWVAPLSDQACVKTPTEQPAPEAIAQEASSAVYFAQALHDIRSLLSVVRGYSELVLRNPSDCRKTAQLVQRIITSTDHLAALTSELVTITSCDSGHLKLQLGTVHLKNELSAAVEAYELQCHQKGLAFVCRFADSLPEYVRVDALRLRRILGNVLANAIKFTEAGAVELEVRHRGKHLEIRVSDTGPGIPPEMREVVFEPFQQAADSARRYGGSGLGLSVVRRLSRAMGGDAVLERSEVGTGSRFLFSVEAEAMDNPFGGSAG